MNHHRAALLGLTLLLLPACSSAPTIYRQPFPARLDATNARVPDGIVAVLHFGEHASHTLAVVAGPEVVAVSIEPTTLDDDTFHPSSSAVRRWHVVASSADGREEVVAAVAAREVRDDHALKEIVAPGPRLWVATPRGSGEASALAISLDGHFDGLPEARAASSNSLAEALFALRRAQGHAQVARDRGR